MDTILIEKQLEKVPEQIKKVFFSSDVAEKIGAIGENNNLLIDQIGSLIEETGYMVIGLKPSKDFIETISKKLGIDEQTAKKISSEINDNILKDIREDIRKLNDEKESPENETLELTPPPTTTPDPMIKQTIAAIEKAGDFTIENHIDPHPTVQEHIPMVDHLLTTPVSQHIQTEVRKVEEKRSYTSDPYREEV